MKKNKLNLTILIMIITVVLVGCGFKLTGLYLSVADGLGQGADNSIEIANAYGSYITRELEHEGVRLASPIQQYVSGNSVSSDNLPQLDKTSRDLCELLVFSNGKYWSSIVGHGGMEVEGLGDNNEGVSIDDALSYDGIQLKLARTDSGSWRVKLSDSIDGLNSTSRLEGYIQSRFNSINGVDPGEATETVNNNINVIKSVDELNSATQSLSDVQLAFETGVSNFKAGKSLAEELKDDAEDEETKIDVRNACYGTISDAVEDAIDGSNSELDKIMLGSFYRNTSFSGFMNPCLKNNEFENGYIYSWKVFAPYDKSSNTGIPYLITSETTLCYEDKLVFSEDGSTISANEVKLPVRGYKVTDNFVTMGEIYVLKHDITIDQIKEVHNAFSVFYENGNTNFLSAKALEELESNNNVTIFNSETATSGVAIANQFEKAEVRLIPSCFNLVCSSFIPRKLELSQGEIYKVDGIVKIIRDPIIEKQYTNAEDDYVGLGYFGPNLNIIRVMSDLYGTSNTGFIVMNSQYFLCSYPISVISYLYTDDDKAYIGLGNTSMYYSIITGRVAYRIGKDYAYSSNAGADTVDELYQDVNNLGGLGEGITILGTTRTLLAPKVAVENSSEAFKKLIEDNYIDTPSVYYDTRFDSVVGDETNGNVMHFLSKSGGKDLVDYWADTMTRASITVPQFVLLDYVESGWAPGVGGGAHTAVLGRRIRIDANQIKKDTNGLYYFNATATTTIGHYRNSADDKDGSVVRLGDIVDVRALMGLGRSYLDTEDVATVQPPNGFNVILPVGAEVEESINQYESAVHNLTKRDADVVKFAFDWARTNMGTNGSIPDTVTINDLYNVSNETLETSASGYNYNKSFANNVTNDSAFDDTPMVVPLAVSGTPLDPRVAYGTLTDEPMTLDEFKQAQILVNDNINKDTLVTDLAYYPSDFIVFSVPFPNLQINEADYNLFMVEGTANANSDKLSKGEVFYTIGKVDALMTDNLYSGWICSDSSTDSLLWWNNYLNAHGFEYSVNAQLLRSYLETHYSYLANGGNVLSLNGDVVAEWERVLTEESVNGDNKLGYWVSVISRTMGLIMIVYAILLVMAWLLDIYSSLSKDLYKLMTGGKMVASIDSIESKGNLRFVTFGNALLRSGIIIVGGVFLVFVGAGPVIASMLRLTANILEFIINR